jgi:mono/diheme cytochrome c family protein
MPGNRFNIWGLQTFLFDCARDPGSPANSWSLKSTAPCMRAARKLGPLDRYVVYPVAIALMRERLLMLAGRFEPLLRYPAWGPGRVDTFNAAKVIFNFPIDALPEREKNAPSDFPSILVAAATPGHAAALGRQTNSKVEERNKSAAFGTGTTPPTIDVAAIARIEKWLLTLQPPKYPYPIDRAQAARGATVYAQHCASCHGASGRDFRGAYVGKVTPQAAVGTDRRRLTATRSNSRRTNRRCMPAIPGASAHFRKTYGYANMPLDGLWLRAPYLHNGSVAYAARPARARCQPAASSSIAATTSTIRSGSASSATSPRATVWRSSATTRACRQFQRRPRRRGLRHRPAPADKDALVAYLKTF